MVSPNTLRVELDGVAVKELTPGSPICYFGRGEDCDIRIGHRLPGGGDRNISRVAGSIRRDNGWTVHNESDSRPFDLIIDGTVFPRPPGQADRPWAVSPPGLDIRIVTPFSAHVIGLKLPDPTAPHAEQAAPEPDDLGASTFSLNQPTEHERLLLVAKFLSSSWPGDAIGNSDAARRINTNQPERQVTARAVEDAARKWKERLEALGVTDIDGRENVNYLGRQLLAYGFIRQEDRGLLPAE